MIRNNIVTYAATLGGALLVLVGLVGLCFSKILGLPYGALLSLLHLASGGVAVYFGLRSSSPRMQRTFCLSFGAFYGLVGVASFIGYGLPIGLVHFGLGAGFVVAAMLQPSRSSIYADR